MRSQSGFTLIEVMAVVLIIGLTVLGISFSFGRDSGARLDEASDSLLAWLQDAVSRSVMDGGIYGVHVGADGLGLRFNFRGQWYQVTDAENWMPPTGVSLNYSEPDRIERDSDVPQLIVLPSLELMGGSQFLLDVGEASSRLYWDSEHARFAVKEDAS